MAAKSQMARGGLRLAWFATDLCREVVKLGGTEEMMFEAMKTNSGFAKKAAQLIVVVEKKVDKVAGNILHIPASLSLADRIAFGKYDWVNSHITKEHFPLNIPTDYDAEHKLFHFSRFISSENAIQEMKKEGYRPGILPELLVLGEIQPELQREFPIIALGSVWQHANGNQRVPVLRQDDGKRELDLYLFVLGWIDRCRFLAVRK